MLLPISVLVMLIETAEGQECDRGDLQALELQLSQLDINNEGNIQALYTKITELSFKTKTHAESLTKLINDTNDKDNIAFEHMNGIMRKVLEERDSFKVEMNDGIENANGQTDALTERLQDVVNEQTSFGPSIERIVDAILQLKLEIDAADCMDGWLIFNGSCYLFNDSQVTFFEAATACKDSGAHLVYVESKTENDFIKGVLSRMNDMGFWMGVTDVDKEGMWLYYGTNVTPQFYDWEQGQPDNWQGTEDCVHYWASYDYRWNDQDCPSPMSFICEREIGS